MRILLVALLSFLCLNGCKPDKKTSRPIAETEREAPSKPAPKDVPNQLTEAEKAAGWRLLFDGETLNGWHTYNQPEAKPVWEAKNGMLTLEPIEGNGKHGDLVTNGIFENYELLLEWKITENGNSGIFINVQEDPKYKFTYQTGPEYSLLDPAHPNYATPEKRSGCIYNYLPQLTPTDLRPVGEWNTAKIKQVNGKVEFYLNGNLTAQADLHSPEWNAWITGSGFKDFSEFGKATKGHIGLQEWSSNAWFRNIKIREL